MKDDSSLMIVISFIPLAVMVESVTLESISKACGVSHITASRALRGLKNVKPETAMRIREYADSVGYKPNLIARSLARGKSGSFNLATSDSIILPFNKEAVDRRDRMESVLFWDYAEGAVFAASSRKSSIEVIGFSDGKAEFDFIRALVEDQRVAGILDFGLTAPTMDYIRSTKVPVVSRLQGVHNTGSYDHASVYPDHLQGYLLAWRHLLALGHRKIGYIARADHGMHLNVCIAASCLIADAPQLEKVVWIDHSTNSDSVRDGLLAAFGPWGDGEWPTAFFCSNDQVANATIVSLGRIGVRVPDDISIVGFDDSPAARFCNPGITTLRNPRKEIGAAMFHLLTDIIAGRPNSKNRMEILTMQLIERDSVRDLRA